MEYSYKTLKRSSASVAKCDEIRTHNSNYIMIRNDVVKRTNWERSLMILDTGMIEELLKEYTVDYLRMLNSATKVCALPR
jgi:hypothetical protein